MKKGEANSQRRQTATDDKTVIPESSLRHEHLAYQLGRLPLDLRWTVVDGYESLFTATHRPGIPEIEHINWCIKELHQITEYLSEQLPEDKRRELSSAVLQNLEAAVKSYFDACSMYAELFHLDEPELLAYLNGEISLCTEGYSVYSN